MNIDQSHRWDFMIIGLIVLGWGTGFVPALSHRVLVVVSYEKDNPWVIAIKHDIDRALGHDAEVRYVYMNTKIDLANDSKKAEAAYQEYQDFAPHSVIAADDNAQAMFVVPFLKDAVTAPVVFCGVNVDPACYDYPASNVTGILERGHIRESMSFARQLVPDLTAITLITRLSLSGLALREQVRAEAADYPIPVSGFHLVETVADLAALGAALDPTTDALYLDSLTGLADDHGRPLDNRQVFSHLFTVFKGPVTGANPSHVEQGAQCQRPHRIGIDAAPDRPARRHVGQNIVNQQL